MFQPKGRVSILAGNSRVYFNESNEVTVDCQLMAFDAALSCAKKIQESEGYLPRISVAFDHLGIFRLQFLAEGLTNSQKRNPRLNNLHYSIQELYETVSEKHQIALCEISVIHEDSARQHLVHILSTEKIPENIFQRLVTKVHVEQSKKTAELFNRTGDQKLTCGAITKEYFDKAAGGKSNADEFLEVFFEDTKWSRSFAYGRGVQLCHMLGLSTGIRLNLVNAFGEISRGEIIIPP
ncbi:hypothetical protein ASE93_21295 [Serratia sp. Leaf50]|nr:hypothetical protein ASE93_21295 [Serratia sp. Leaf50]